MNIHGIACHYSLSNNTTFLITPNQSNHLKQKVVIEVGSMNTQKLRSKALKIAVSCAGVEAAGLKGEGKKQIEVTGEGIDAVALTNVLRKRVGFAEIVSVGPEKEKKEEKEGICYYGQSVPHYYPFCEYSIRDINATRGLMLAEYLSRGFGCAENVVTCQLLGSPARLGSRGVLRFNGIF
ncbi:heavy metal-associated isoprenylated plant protein 16 [Senna tora]|uniref:Heavy metal-associated isoprenylated plant protein 16 n=1 Tax=Senna tora TaxID=362788 RepID=A0A834WWM4_9FABA|nr:heavy metal-associated isoprenylated plant protein 16 [Senna tora]